MKVTLTTWLLVAPLAVFAKLPASVERLRAPKFTIVDDPIEKRAASPQYTIPTFSNPKAAAFHVNSSALPLVKFTLQDSWAGLLPISANTGETRKLSFFYWPSSQTGGSKQLTIWLNGGPGCSSFEGFLEENGPISYQPGTSGPVANPYGWTTATDVVCLAILKFLSTPALTRSQHSFTSSNLSALASPAAHQTLQMRSEWLTSFTDSCE